MSNTEDKINEAEANHKGVETLVNNIAANANASPSMDTSANNLDPSKLGILNDVAIQLTIEVGRAQIKIRDLLNLSKDSIVDLNKAAGEPVDIYANGRLIAKGNIITANGKYCVRLVSIVKDEDR